MFAKQPIINSIIMYVVMKILKVTRTTQNDCTATAVNVVFNMLWLIQSGPTALFTGSIDIT